MPNAGRRYLRGRLKDLEKYDSFCGEESRITKGLRGYLQEGTPIEKGAIDEFESLANEMLEELGPAEDFPMMRRIVEEDLELAGILREVQA